MHGQSKYNRSQTRDFIGTAFLCNNLKNDQEIIEPTEKIWMQLEMALQAINNKNIVQIDDMWSYSL